MILQTNDMNYCATIVRVKSLIPLKGLDNLVGLNVFGFLKLSLSAKRKELETLEGRLEKLVSPELRARMELELIEKELGL